MSVCVFQLEQQRQQLLTERQTFHTEQLKQAEIKVRQQREQQGQPGYTVPLSGPDTQMLLRDGTAANHVNPSIY